MCMILGFKNINDTLLKGVKQSHKTDLKSLVELTCVDHANSTSYHEGKTVYISEPGLYKLVFASRLETAEAFQDWVCKEVLPSIRKTGSYDIQTLKNELALRDKSHQEQLTLKEQSHQEELDKAMQTLTLKDQVKKEYKTALKFIEPSVRHCLVVPSTNHESRAGV